MYINSCSCFMYVIVIFLKVSSPYIISFKLYIYLAFFSSIRRLLQMLLILAICSYVKVGCLETDRKLCMQSRACQTLSFTVG